MDTLAQDIEEVAGNKKLERWVRRQRRRNGIGPDEPSTWEAVVNCGEDSNMIDIGRSPSDVLWLAELTVEEQGGAYRDVGVGHWILEASGTPEEPDRVLRVRPVYDPEAPRFDDQGPPAGARGGLARGGA